VIFQSQNESVPVPPQLLQITIITHSKVIKHCISSSILVCM